jgi:hypothetical protein
VLRLEDGRALGAAADVGALCARRNELRPQRERGLNRTRERRAALTVAAEDRRGEHADQQDDRDEDCEQQRPHAAAIGSHYAARATPRTTRSHAWAVAQREAGLVLEM